MDINKQQKKNARKIRWAIERPNTGSDGVFVCLSASCLKRSVMMMECMEKERQVENNLKIKETHTEPSEMLRY